MLTRLLIAAVLLFALGDTAFASEKGGVFHRISCTVVRYYVAKYSEPAAEAWARSKGATDAEIETAHRCLGRSATMTASTK